MTRYELLDKPLWSLEDVKFYFGCSTTRASKMMQAAKKISISRFMPSRAKRDNLFIINGLNYADEVRNMKILKEVEEKNDNKNECKKL